MIFSGEFGAVNDSAPKMMIATLHASLVEDWRINVSPETDNAWSEHLCRFPIMLDDCDRARRRPQNVKSIPEVNDSPMISTFQKNSHQKSQSYWISLRTSWPSACPLRLIHFYRFLRTSACNDRVNKSTAQQRKRNNAKMHFKRNRNSKRTVHSIDQTVKTENHWTK